MKHRILLVIPLLFLISCQSRQKVEYLQSKKFTAQNEPFSEAVRVGNMLYLSGQVGNKPGEMNVVPGGIGPETRQTMENIKEVLERFGSSMDQVVKCLCMLEDINEWAEMSAEYVKFFPNHKPARSAFAGTGLAIGAKVEIECMATID
ncbi:MAG: RidA family protein [Candidatus Marinimicrobia bacterium]|jgi:reactive intermediate/imine deaminase|nr:RidA family protein [Candidatus Neomarinimicrobiota bacterium]MBT3764141.1 RidA family protein [Candidatus Neomarinimicrobiota bacterium]MBT4270625.1 RidA family protein [Candidatus Neomarinimicrobiota bacterium]MBT4371377.1 RidA family protein [Candidatus Neomarinimicrobiota bacterium]MBT6129492.1 RidA family protein [Candidatus Neomarinimicrobiota bacterium]